MLCLNDASVNDREALFGLSRTFLMGVLFCEYILHAVVRSEGSTLVNQTVIFPAYHNELAQPKTILLI